MRIPERLTLFLFLMEKIKTLISKFSIQPTISLPFSAFGVKLVLQNHLKIYSVFF